MQQLAELLLWCTLAHYGAKKARRTTAAVLACGLLLSMASQLWLLQLDGLLDLRSGLPLHLCGFSALLCMLLCWRWEEHSFHFVVLLGLPGALLALVFPAAAVCSHPLWMRTAFIRLHALIPAVCLFLLAQKKPLPSDPRRVFLLGNGLMLLAACTNALTGSNYLFLRAAPVGTPLAWLIRPGYGTYLAGLELLCMLVLSSLCAVVRSIYLRK
jgi:hypothetical integral membrane protein (TIGR02206 family)